MAKKKGLTKRLGARYGTTVKVRLEKVESEQRKKHKCPQCNAPTVKRVAVGIWQCKKCKTKFAGGAYSPRVKTKKSRKGAA